jgi:hypothetical protein
MTFDWLKNQSWSSGMSKFLKAVCMTAFGVSMVGCRQNSTDQSAAEGPPTPNLTSVNGSPVLSAEDAQWARASDDMLLDAPAALSIETVESRSLLAGRAGGTFAPAAVTHEQVIRWHKQGTPAEVILDRLQTSQSVFHLTAAEENRLRDAGISEYIIRVMKDTARRAN